MMGGVKELAEIAVDYRNGLTGEFGQNDLHDKKLEEALSDLGFSVAKDNEDQWEVHEL